MLTAEVGLFLFALFGAFSEPVRKEIGKRDKWTCQHPGCGRKFRDGWMIHISHITHRRDAYYDTPGRGEARCIEHHLLYHRKYVGNAEAIGLTEEANNRAIELLQATPWRTRNG